MKDFDHDRCLKQLKDDIVNNHTGNVEDTLSSIFGGNWNLDLVSKIGEDQLKFWYALKNNYKSIQNDLDSS